MKTYKIALIKGDGIGPEIIDEAVKVLDSVSSCFDFDFEYTEALMGGCAYDIAGDPLPQETINASLNSDAVLFGATHETAVQVIAYLRWGLGNFANVRPIKYFKGFGQKHSSSRCFSSGLFPSTCSRFDGYRHTWQAFSWSTGA